MEERPFFHEGMREFQDMFDGRRVAEAIETHRKHYAFWDDEIDIIETAPFFFIASTYGEYVDCNIKSGDPGFIRVTGPGTLEYPEYDGNSMFRTLGNIARNPNVGLLFVKFDGKSRRIRVNGKASVILDPAVVGKYVGAKAVVRIECEIYPNCPRYLPNLADSLPSPHVPREGQGTPPPPEWKHRDYIRDVLPADDPHIPVVKHPFKPE
ncbi:pyridoxamine 5'-phosphate oxidase family protein [Noviherbaspirillum cavernae]|uniref:Pyridoxamine 5'-phosphate oxidase family protein n=1 Tax=Noviherbaspirillum cavernae TaxID=2320862 RepID=A0A418WW97_9BURK|nr:pyridoxamine 5'-phosphate oxidase family protein [Noviherbaspirillum cavernae]RJF96801.1 pyridoxamine 5'-phosphate oxidase family protein [Noviherbaspirillum cavernae]